MVITELGFDDFMVSRACTLLEKEPQTLFGSVQWCSFELPFVVHFLSRRLMCSEKCAFDAALKWHICSIGGNAAQNSPTNVCPQADAQRPAGTEILLPKTCEATSDADRGSISKALAEVEAGGVTNITCVPKDDNVKKRRIDEGNAALPEQLRSLIVFEQMSLQELYACKQHIPFIEYVDYLEVISKLVDAKRGPRSDRPANPPQHTSIRRCKHCFMDHCSDPVPCKRVHTKEPMLKTHRVFVEPRFLKHRRNRCGGCRECRPAHWEDRQVTSYPCCDGGLGSFGCSQLEHEWESVWTFDVLR